MDRATLEKTIELEIVDPNSCDTITKNIRSGDGLLREEFYLKEMGCPTPSLEVYGNIPCVLLRPEMGERGPALLTAFEQGSQEMEKTAWVRDLVTSGFSTLGIDFSSEDTPGVVVAKLMRCISYLDLRRDIVDPKRICVAGSGEFGLWALSAAALDPRVIGAMTIGIPSQVSLSNGPIVKTLDLIGLVQPRRVAILETPERDALAEGLADGADAVRFENESKPETVDAAIRWLMGKE